MITRSKMVGLAAVLSLAGLVAACGGGSSTPGYVQSGKLVQGPVSGARVFADRVQGGVRFVEDGGEVVAVTGANGSFTLPTLPNYTYVLVSKGGFDTLANMPAMQLLAPAGAKNITPLTTLVVLDQSNPTLDSTKGVLKKIEAMLPAGTKYDADVSENSSPAVLLLVKSVETAAKSLTDAIVTNSANGISATQNSYIQAQIMQAIAQTLAGSGVTQDTLSTPAQLQATLTTALDTALTNIITDNANVTIPVPSNQASLASGIAQKAVSTAAISLGTTSSQNTALKADVVAKEVSLISYASAFLNAVADTVTAIIGSTINAVVTPSTFNPPVIPVNTVTIAIVITGASGSTGSSGSGTQF